MNEIFVKATDLAAMQAQGWVKVGEHIDLQKVTWSIMSKQTDIEKLVAYAKGQAWI